MTEQQRLTARRIRFGDVPAAAETNALVDAGATATAHPRRVTFAEPAKGHDVTVGVNMGASSESAPANAAPLGGKRKKTDGREWRDEGRFKYPVGTFPAGSVGEYCSWYTAAEQEDTERVVRRGQQWTECFYSDVTDRSPSAGAPTGPLGAADGAFGTGCFSADDLAATAAIAATAPTLEGAAPDAGAADAGDTVGAALAAPLSLPVPRLSLNSVAHGGHGASVAVVPVAVDRSGGGSERPRLAAYVPPAAAHGIVFGKGISSASRRGRREAIVEEASGWLPHLGVPEAAYFLAGEVTCHGEGFDAGSSVVVVTAPVDLSASPSLIATSAARFIELSGVNEGAVGVWATIDAIAELQATCDDPAELTAVYRVAATAVAQIDSYLRPTCDGPAHSHVGARAAANANTSASTPAPASKQLPERASAADAAAVEFRDLLRGVSTDEGDGSFAAFCHGLADSVSVNSREALPPELYDYTLPEPPADLLQRRYIHLAQVPETKPLPPPRRPKAPPGGWWPHSIEDIVEGWALKEIRQWLADCQRWHARGGPQDGRPHAKAFGTDAIKPKARGYKWDLRGGPGNIYLWDDTWEDKRTCIKRGYAAELLADCDDQELVSMIASGVRFKCDGLAHQIVLMPNLLSLYQGAGIAAAAEQMNDMRDEGWLGLFGDELPSVPFRCVPRGEVAKRGTAELRGIADQGQPRKHLSTRFSNEPVSSLNSEARLGDWDHESKDTIEGACHNASIVQGLADLNGESVISIALDWSKFFHRLFYNAYELWQTGALVPDAKNNSLLAFALEYVLTMGATPSSQIAQRFATAMTAKLCAIFDAEEAARWADPSLASELNEATRAALARRAQLGPDKSYGSQAKMYDVLMYSDDLHASISGARRALRFIRCLHNTLGPGGLNMPLSRASKQQAGVDSLWLGARISGALGLVWLPADKATRAARQIEATLAGEIDCGEYRSLTGLLVHLLFMVGGDKALLYHIFRPFQRGNEFDGGPAAKVRVDPAMRGVLGRWLGLINNTPGCAILAAVSPLAWEAVERRHRIRTDAALLGTEAPGLGGWYAGEWWCVPLDSVAGLELLDIPHLELLAACIGLLVWEPLLGNARLVELETDALATAVALTLRARSPTMQSILDALLARPEYAALAPKLQVKHCWGAANPLADGASRGYHETIRVISAALGVESRRVELPAAALAFLADALGRVAVARDAAAQHAPPPPEPPSKPSALMPGLGLAGTAQGMSNPSMTANKPFAHGAACDDSLSPPTPPSMPPPAGCRLLPMATSPPALEPSRTRSPTPALTPPSAPAARLRPPRPPSSVGGTPPPHQKHARGLLPQLRDLPYLLPTSTPSRRPPPAFELPEVPAITVSTPPARPPLEPSSPRAPPTPMPPWERSELLDPPSPPVVPTRPSLAKKARGPERKAVIDARQRRAARADSVAMMLQEDDSAYSIGASAEDVQWMAEAAAVGDPENVSANTIDQLNSNWRAWCRFITRFDINGGPMRPELGDLNALGRKREQVIWSCALMWIWGEMKPANGKFLPPGPPHFGAPKPPSPESALAILRGVRRIHTDAGIETPSLKLATRRMTELMMQYAKDVGPENVAPVRKAPLTHKLISDMLYVRDGAPILKGGKPWHWSTAYGRSTRTLIHVLAQTGFRKAEVALHSNVKWDSMRISFSNLTWWIGGTQAPNPTAAQLLGLKDGDFACLQPPPSKADQFGRKWANNLIWLPFDALANINAARALSQWELSAGVKPEDRRTTPLFCGPRGVGSSLMADAFDTIFHSLLLTVAHANGVEAKELLAALLPQLPRLGYDGRRMPRQRDPGRSPLVL